MRKKNFHYLLLHFATTPGKDGTSRRSVCRQISKDKSNENDKDTDLVEIEQGLGWQIGVLGFHSPFLHRTFDL